MNAEERVQKLERQIRLLTMMCGQLVGALTITDALPESVAERLAAVLNIETQEATALMNDFRFGLDKMLAATRQADSNDPSPPLR